MPDQAQVVLLTVHQPVTMDSADSALRMGRRRDVVGVSRR